MKIKLSILIFVFIFLAGNVVYASEISGTLSSQGNVPIAPVSISVEKTGEKEITITWSAVAGVEGYKVYKIKDGKEAELIADNVEDLTYKDKDLDDGLYSYQIQPFIGNLSPSIEDISPTLPTEIKTTPAPSPAPPTGGGGGGGSYTPPTSTTPPTPLSEAAQVVDTNEDDKIDILDFNSLVINWGSTEIDNIADFDSNGTVDIFDFNLLMTYWTG